MNLPRLQPTPGLSFDEGTTIAVGNALIRQLEQRLNSLAPCGDDFFSSMPRLAEVELEMYAVLRHPRADYVDKLEAVLRYGYQYEARSAVKSVDRFFETLPNMQGRHMFAQLSLRANGNGNGHAPETSADTVPSGTVERVGVSG